MNKTFTLYLYQTPHGTQKDPSFTLSDTEGMEAQGWHLMRVVPVTVELPEPEDVRKIKLHALELEEQELRAKFANRITQLQRMKNELLTIEMEVA